MLNVDVFENEIDHVLQMKKLIEPDGTERVGIALQVFPSCHCCGFGKFTLLSCVVHNKMAVPGIKPQHQSLGLHSPTPLQDRMKWHLLR